MDYNTRHFGTFWAKIGMLWKRKSSPRLTQGPRENNYGFKGDSKELLTVRNHPFRMWKLEFYKAPCSDLFYSSSTPLTWSWRSNPQKLVPLRMTPSSFRQNLSALYRSLQTGLNQVTEWSTPNNMVLHQDKFEVMNYCPNESLLLRHLPFTRELRQHTTSDGSIVEPANVVRDLGVYPSNDCY